MGRRKRESPLEVAMQWIAKKNDSPGFQIDRFKDKGMLIVKPSPSQALPHQQSFGNIQELPTSLFICPFVSLETCVVKDNRSTEFSECLHNDRELYIVYTVGIYA